MRQCPCCAAVVYGRADKRYCSATCRRDASRIRKRVIRFKNYSVFGSEKSQPSPVEDILVPRLVREYGHEHAVVLRARRAVADLRRKEVEELRAMLKGMNWFNSPAETDIWRTEVAQATMPRVPRISEFYGIVITMYYAEHAPAHFHAIYAGDDAAILIESLGILAGSLPPRQLRQVREWADLHRVELERNWTLARAEQPLDEIAPLA